MRVVHAILERIGLRRITPAHGRLELTVLIERDEDDGGFVSSIVDLPGVRSQGDTEKEAIDNVLDALRCALDAATADVTTGDETSARREPDGPRRVAVSV